jgi:hypothetical protein
VLQGPDIPPAELQALISDHIAEGRLPTAVIRKVKASYGSGSGCAVCGHEIGTQQVEYEVTDERNADLLLFHFNCYVAWYAECIRRDSTTSNQPGGASSRSRASPGLRGP